MTYISITFYLFVTAVLLLYYILPLKYRWFVLLGGSLLFYWEAMGTGSGMAVILATTLAAYGAGVLLERVKNRGVLAAAVLLMVIPCEKWKLCAGGAAAPKFRGVDCSAGHFLLYITGDILFSGCIQGTSCRPEKSCKIHAVCDVFSADCTGADTPL